MSSICKEINVFYFFNLTTALVIYSVCMQTSQSAITHAGYKPLFYHWSNIVLHTEEL